MGTRGIMGVRYNVIDKLTYNHFDSYPSGLGEAVLRDIRSYCTNPPAPLGAGHIGKRAAGLEIDPKAPPVPVLPLTPEQIAQGIDCMRERFNALRFVKDDDKPTPADIARLKKFANLSVAGGDTAEWYVLLRELQGKLRKTLEAGVMIEGNNFIRDSLFCEWGYIVDLDDGTLEVYRGFQKAPHKKGRYAKLPRDKGPDGKVSDYYPCALLCAIPFAELGPDTMSAIEKSQSRE